MHADTKQIKVSVSHGSLPEKDDDFLLDAPRENGPQIMTLSLGSWEIHCDKFLACISLIANEVPDRMYSGKDMAKLLNSGYSMILWFYSIPFWLSRDLFPAWWCRGHSSFSHRLSGTVKPARMHRMQRTKFCLCSGQHCHLPVLDSHSSPNYLKTCFCAFPFALTTVMPPRGALSGRTFLAYRNSIEVITARHTGLPTTWVMLQSHTFSFISCSHPLGHEIWAKTVVCLFSIQNSMDEQSILWETFAQENQIFLRMLQA